jgi:hypothetical protein
MKTLSRLLIALTLLACASAQASYFDQLQLVPGATGGAGLNSQIAPATPAVRTVKAAAGTFYGIQCFNILATPVYINLFDLASGSITLGTTAATYKLMCPGNTAGAGFVIPITIGVAFANAINYSVSNAIGLTDNTSITANSVIVNVVYQ